jgi:hypothetical protein
VRGGWDAGGWKFERGVWVVVVGEVGGVVCIGVVVAFRLWEGLGVLGLAMVGVNGDWVVVWGAVRGVEGSWGVGGWMVERGV